MFIIGHPLSSMDNLENNCYIKKAENMLSFKHLAFTFTASEINLYKCAGAY